MPEQRDRVLIIGPVNKHPIPYHYGQYTKIDPMGPTHQKQMFFFITFILSEEKIYSNRWALQLSMGLKPIDRYMN
jgi:hypothetical protein